MEVIQPKVRAPRNRAGVPQRREVSGWGFPVRVVAVSWCSQGRPLSGPWVPSLPVSRDRRG